VAPEAGWGHAPAPATSGSCAAQPHTRRRHNAPKAQSPPQAELAHYSHLVAKVKPTAMKPTPTRRLDWLSWSITGMWTEESWPTK
jgi:hypothetical protein